ncbi:sensor histidine kinase [Nocardioides pacificus]
MVAMFTVATLRPRRVAAALFPGAIAVIALAHRTVEGVTWAMAVQAGVTCLVAWALGDATRRWAKEWARETEDAAAQAARAVAEERTRIARELHDVVSHHMSVVALQSGLAEYVLDTDPAVARTAIGHVGAAGREALLDLRRMLDALRDEETETAPYDPQPGLGQVEALVARLRGTGLDVDLRTPTPTPDLPPGLALCAYRVVQEALTNVLKHAGPAGSATVSITEAEGVLTVDVADDGAGSPAMTTPPGHGIRGMRERAALYGGVLHAGPRPAGGWRVLLRLPLVESS